MSLSFLAHFEMAIHQHMSQYAQNQNINTSNLNDILLFIALITEKIEQVNGNTEFMHTLCGILIKKIAEVPVPRDAENIQAVNADSNRIIEFFEGLRSIPRSENVSGFVLDCVYKLITQDADVSPLTCLGLAVIPESMIGSAVAHILNVNHHQTNQKKSIMNAVGRLILWLRMTKFNVPLGTWIVKVLGALQDEKHYEILHDIILEHISACYVALIIPSFQVSSLAVTLKVV